MIEQFVQPKEIKIEKSLSLVKYYPNYKRTLPWYQDLALCKQVDNIDFPYDRERLSRMYRYLSTKGECYYLKLREHGRSRLIGDISLYDGMIAIVVCREYQNRHLGRKALNSILRRAKEIGLPRVEAEIYDFNLQSQRVFLSCGFKQIGAERYEYVFEREGAPV